MVQTPNTMTRLQVLSAILAIGLFGAVAPGRAERPSMEAQSSSRRHTMHSGDHRTWCALHSTRKEYRLAIEDCDELLQLNPNDAEALSDRGSAHFLGGEPDRAINDFNEAIRLVATDPEY